VDVGIEAHTGIAISAMKFCKKKNPPDFHLVGYFAVAPVKIGRERR